MTFVCIIYSRIMKLKNSVINNVEQIVEDARKKAIRSVDFQRVLMYWRIGQVIFEEEQNGRHRAKYGSFLIRSISDKFLPIYGTGFSKRQLELNRQFYKLFPIANALRSQLSWTHYRMLIRINDPQKLEFYIAESTKNNWSARQLERQINSQLFERLLSSNHVKDVLAVANAEKAPISAKEIIKDPMILEFLGLKKESSYYEKDFEGKILGHLQEFLLELGNGFTFVARQKRIHIDGDEFFIDLVFYNRLLRCFVLLEIKTTKLTHQDLGQLQMYVNYFDRFEKQSNENATIGIILCADKNDMMVKITLPENNHNIVASQYQLYLPSEKQLIEEVQKECI